MSKALYSILSTAALAVFIISTAMAGNYHSGDSLTCSDCHLSHASVSHGSDGQPTNLTVVPNRHLTKAETTTDLCLQCHDNQPGIPDVLGDDFNNPGEQYDGSERAAGRFAEDDSDNWKGHNLPSQGSRTPGDCTVCHDPHGNGNYRNLRAIDESSDGPVAFVNPSATGLDRYSRSNIGYVKNIGDKLCVRCHDYGTAASGAGGQYHRHPSSDGSTVVKVGAYGTVTDVQHWIRGNGSGFEVSGESVPRVPFAASTATSFERATAVSGDNEVFCLSCHKAHGSVHAFGTLWAYGSQGLQGSSGCNQCHNTSGD